MGVTVQQGFTAASSGWDMTGQTWQDVSASRAEGTSYQNTTGKPIQVSVSIDPSSGFSAGWLQVSSNNSTWLDAAYGGANGGKMTANPIIPPSWYYRVATSASYAISEWLELR